MTVAAEMLEVDQDFVCFLREEMRKELAGADHMNWSAAELAAKLAPRLAHIVDVWRTVHAAMGALERPLPAVQGVVDDGAAASALRAPRHYVPSPELDQWREKHGMWRLWAYSAKPGWEMVDAERIREEARLQRRDMIDDEGMPHEWVQVRHVRDGRPKFRPSPKTVARVIEQAKEQD